MKHLTTKLIAFVLVFLISIFSQSFTKSNKIETTKNFNCQYLNWKPGVILHNWPIKFIAGEYYVTVSYSPTTEIECWETVEYLVKYDGDLNAILNYLELKYGWNGYTIDYASGCYIWEW